MSMFLSHMRDVSRFMLCRGGATAAKVVSSHCFSKEMPRGHLEDSESFRIHVHHRVLCLTCTCFYRRAAFLPFPASWWPRWKIITLCCNTEQHRNWGCAGADTNRQKSVKSKTWRNNHEHEHYPVSYYDMACLLLKIRADFKIVSRSFANPFSGYYYSNSDILSRFVALWSEQVDACRVGSSNEWIGGTEAASSVRSPYSINIYCIYICT